MIADAMTPVMNVPMNPVSALDAGVCIGAAASIACWISASDFPCSSMTRRDISLISLK